MKTNKGWMDWNEALDQIMKYKGISRQEAHVQLVEKCRQGKIATRGVNPDNTNETVSVPPEAWPKIN